MGHRTRKVARFVPRSWQILFSPHSRTLSLSNIYLIFQRRKTNNKPRDASTPHGSTAAESVRNLIKKNPKYSKRINYDALKDLFTDVDTGSAVSLIKMSQPPTPAPHLDDDDEGDEDGYILDEKSDGEGMHVVVEEGGGGVGAAARISKEQDAEGDDDDMYGDESDKGEDYVEWEGYEQEV